MRGIRLVDMEASDMLDLLHALFEEDNMASSAEEFEAKGKMREALYRDLYGRTIRYGAGAPSSSSKIDVDYDLPDSQNFDDLRIDEDIRPFDPMHETPNEPTKPFIPPTQFDPDDELPFGNILGAPEG